MTVREAAFADDRWYPSRPDTLAHALDRLVPASPSANVMALVAPHAGWFYSGAVAGAVYGAADVPDRVVVIGPNHRGAGARKAVMSQGFWRIPGLSVPIDAEAVSALVARAPGLRDDRAAHVAEHSLELQVPFLARRNPDVSLVPLCLWPQPLDDCLRLGEALAGAVRALPGKTLLVASSDMNHYESKARGNAKDRLAIERVLALDPEGLFETVAAEDISMCGVVPATIVLAAARALGATGGRLVRYADSGDADGRRDQVVGYAGLIVS